MGTSVSQPSPRKSNWKRVLVCYENNNLPEDRVVNEIWRASETAETGSQALSVDLKSETIYACYKAVQTSKTFQEAQRKFSATVLETKTNSIITEFAKRAIPASFQSNSPTTQWASNLFREVTNYIVSRDASGFVGKNYRNKSVKELIQFKNNLGNRVNQVIGGEGGNLRSTKEWNAFVDSCITKLKTPKK